MLIGLVFLRKLVMGEVSDAAGLACLSFREPSFRSRGKLFLALPYCSTSVHASLTLFRLTTVYNNLISEGSNIYIFCIPQIV